MTNDNERHSRMPSAAPDANIPKATVGRLILYARELSRMRRLGETYVSSKLLGEMLMVSDAVVRRDLSYLGQLGQRGVGYEVAPLIDQIRETMGTHRSWKVALVGAGSLGNALLKYRGFQELGFELVAAFDTNPKLVGQPIATIDVLPMSELHRVVSTEHVTLAILAVPATAAEDVARALADAGVVGILNFAPVALPKLANVCVVNIDLACELQQLTFATVKQLGP